MQHLSAYRITQVCHFSTHTHKHTHTRVGHGYVNNNSLPPGFITSLFASVHAVLVTQQWNSTIVQHMSYKSTSFLKTTIPIHSERCLNLDWRKLRCHLPGIHLNILWHFVRKSRECHVTSRPNRTKWQCDWCHTVVWSIDGSIALPLKHAISSFCSFYYFQGVISTLNI